jgi:RNA polymerase sigma-70 factor, ECF subfamily
MKAPDDLEFTRLVERHGPELRVHCYRMLGSLDEADDLVQETFLRAWRHHGAFERRASLRTWLYKIATNACLDFLDQNRRRPQPHPAVAGDAPAAAAIWEIPWLQPYPDRLLEPVASTEDQPESAVVERETIELAFLVAIQHLPPRQRAVLVLRDVLGWRAAVVAELLEMTIPAVKSALQRARPIIRRQLPQTRSEWTASARVTEQERALLQRFMDAHDRGDPATLAAVLSDDVQLTMPPNSFWFHGSAAVLGFMRNAVGPGSPLHGAQWRTVPTRANRQPAAAGYIRLPGESQYRAQVLNVVRVEAGKITEITAFGPHVFPAFALSPAMPSSGDSFSAF